MIRECRDTSLPRTWTSVNLVDLLDRLQYGYTAKASAHKDGPRFLRITDIGDDGIDWPAVPGCQITAPDLKKYRLADGDIVFARTGSIEKARLVRNPPEAVFASYLIRGRPLLREISPWLGYFVRSSSYVSQAFAASAGIGRPNVNAKALGRFRLPLAPLPEQHRIVEAIESYFTRLDDAVATLERVKANLKRYRASVLKAAVGGRLVPTEAELARKEGREYEPASVLLERILKERRRRWEEFELTRLKSKGDEPEGDSWQRKYREPVSINTANLPDLPEGWCWTSLDALLREPLRNGHSAKASRTGRVRILTLTAVTQGDFSDRNTKVTSADSDRVSDLWLKNGDILIERSNTPELVGTAVMYRGPDDFAIFPDLVIRARLGPGINGRYIEAVLRSEGARRYFRQSAQGIAGSMPKIDQQTVERLLVPLPPRTEQDRIAAEVEDLISVADDAFLRSIANEKRCQRLRQSILRWAFEGRLVDQDPTDEPASVLLERINAERDQIQGLNRENPRRARKGKTG